MDQKIEYNILRIFDGHKFHRRTHTLPASWYRKELAQFVSDAEVDNVISDFQSRGMIEINETNMVSTFTKAGMTYYDEKYYQDQAFDMVDEALNKLKNSRGKNSINTDHRRYPRVQILAEKILEDENLVRYARPYEKWGSMVDLLENGYQAIEMGGIREYLRKIEEDTSDTEQYEKPNEIISHPNITIHGNVINSPIANHHGSITNTVSDNEINITNTKSPAKTGLIEKLSWLAGILGFIVAIMMYFKIPPFK